jgi:hypothetical protein
MDGKSNAIRGRITSVKSTKKITEAMRLVAAAKVGEKGGKEGGREGGGEGGSGGRDTWCLMGRTRGTEETRRGKQASRS